MTSNFDQIATDLTARLSELRAKVMCCRGNHTQSTESSHLFYGTLLTANRLPHLFALYDLPEGAAYLF